MEEGFEELVRVSAWKIFQFRPEVKVDLHVVASVPFHSIELISLVAMHVPLYRPWYSTFPIIYGAATILRPWIIRWRIRLARQ